MNSLKRRRFWIDPPLQLQMVSTVLLLVVASICLVAYSVLHGLAEAAQETHQIFHSLDWILEAVRGPLLISAIISVVASALIALVWSHRFAGPLRVLAAAIARLGHGNFSVPVRIRKFDTHQDLVHEFARMQERLREQLGADARGLRAAAARLKAALPDIPEGHDARSSAQALIEAQEALDSHFQL